MIALICMFVIAAILSWRIGALLERFLYSDLCLPFTRRLGWALLTLLASVGLVVLWRGGAYG